METEEQKMNKKTAMDRQTDRYTNRQTEILINKAVYTAPLVACWWAGAVKWQKKPKKQSDPRPTDIASCRVA